ncbi:hypothetical protein TRE132_57630 [Pseudomonas chlororaphis subsp. aurantiaca]|nr:hypothetical protein TRE132_57630 [Pseudomonas chlororaphis subsp. aurantiaca]
MKMLHPIYFLALGLFGVYTIEFGVVGILPVIIERFAISASQAGLLVGLFALIIAACGPIMVLLLSRFNRKKVLTLALFVFAGTSVLSAYAPNFESLMVLRIIPALFHRCIFPWPLSRPPRSIRLESRPVPRPRRSSAPAWAWCWGCR